MLESAAQIYCRPAVTLEMTTFLCEGGAVVLRAVIPRAQERPVRCREASGQWQAYYRVADENIVAHPLMVRAWERVASGDPVAFRAGKRPAAPSFICGWRNPRRAYARGASLAAFNRGTYRAACSHGAGCFPPYIGWIHRGSAGKLIGFIITLFNILSAVLTGFNPIFAKI